MASEKASAGNDIGNDMCAFPFTTASTFLLFLLRFCLLPTSTVYALFSSPNKHRVNLFHDFLHFSLAFGEFASRFMSSNVSCALPGVVAETIDWYHSRYLPAVKFDVRCLSHRKTFVFGKNIYTFFRISHRPSIRNVVVRLSSARGPGGGLPWA